MERRELRRSIAMLRPGARDAVGRSALGAGPGARLETGDRHAECPHRVPCRDRTPAPRECGDVRERTGVELDEEHSDVGEVAEQLVRVIADESVCLLPQLSFRLFGVLGLDVGGPEAQPKLEQGDTPADAIESGAVIEGGGPGTPGERVFGCQRETPRNDQCRPRDLPANGTFAPRKRPRPS